MVRSTTVGVWILAAVLGCEPSEKASPATDEVAASPAQTDSMVQLQEASPAADEVDSPAETRVPSSPKPSMAPLTETRWVLQTLNGEPARPGAGGKAAELTLQGSESRAAGFAGCNQFTGDYFIGAGELSFGNMAMTKRLCPEGMGLERDFSTALTVTRNYRIDGNTLSLVDQNGTVVAVFKAG